MARQGTGQSVVGHEPPVAIPDKLYFRIGEVAALCGVPSYVLRFWESEFPQLKPNKGGTGQRLYRQRDVEMALHIRRLLYEGKYTIAGARQALKVEHRRREPQLLLAIVENEAPRTSGQTPEGKALVKLRKEMLELLDLVSSSQASRRSSVQSIRREHPPPVRKVQPVAEASQSQDLFS